MRSPCPCPRPPAATARLRPPALALAALLALACGGAHQYERVDLEAARQLLASRELRVVQVVPAGTRQEAPLPGSLRWPLASDTPASPPSTVAGAAVLLVASAERLGERGAAALARSGNAPVFLFIPASAEERAQLYAFALEIEEIPGGRDS